MGKFFLCLLSVLLGAMPLFGENEFGLRLMPVLSAPLGTRNFKTGFGVAASFDWASLSFGKKFKLGVSAGGAFSNFDIEDGSSFGIFEGSLGPFLRWRALDRLSLGAGVNAGIYRYQWKDYSNVRPRVDGAVGIYYHLLPYLSLAADAGFFHYQFAEDKPINAFRFSLGVHLDLGELMRPRARIAGEKIKEDRLFPVSYAWYGDNPFATLRITNNEPNVITEIGASFFLERYMNRETFFAGIPRLLPGESVDLPVRAFFNDSMLDLRENINANALVQISYRSLGSRKQASFPFIFPIFHRNAMSWDDNRRAASFVSTRDPAAVLFARYTASVIRDRIRPDIPVNIQQALALFEALNIYGINYIIDPASSYIELSENASALDSLNYPYQTLFYRGGDCDDLSILFSSLLQALGIDTAFITIPGHIYCAFDIQAEEQAIENPDLPNLIEHEGRFWLPVEITIPDEGFCKAWETGIREWRDAEENKKNTNSEGRAIYPMQENWKVYQPASVPDAGEQLPVMPEDGEIIRAFERELTKLEDLLFKQ
ncbi:MAG: hypothetical protein LBS57_08965 [Treponema sp.]|jgi:hypothetical protein|nr:hypothetical protein [Treponema sp.]